MAGVISIRMNQFCDDLQSGLYKMFQDDELTDFRIIVNQNQSICCHRIILAFNSPVIKAMLASSMNEAQTNTMKLDLFSFQTVKSIISYMYTGKLSIDREQMTEAVEVCNNLQIVQLKDYIDRAMTNYTYMSPQNVLLHYNTSRKLLSGLHQIYQDDELTDFTIEVDQDNNIRCHRIILAYHSPVIKAMLASGMNEAQTNKMKLDLFSFNTIKSIISYMYTGKLTIDREQLTDAFEACNYLQLVQLKNNICKNMTIKSVSLENVLHFYPTADQHELSILKDRCLQYMYFSFNEVFKGEDFLELDETSVVNYLSKCEDYDIPHDIVLKAAFRWLQKNMPNADKLLSVIKLENCSPSLLEELIEQNKDNMDSASLNRLTNGKDAAQLSDPTVQMLAYIDKEAVLLLPEDHLPRKLSNLEINGTIKYVCDIPEGFAIVVDTKLDHGRPGCSMTLMIAQFYTRTKKITLLPGECELGKSINHSLYHDGKIFIFFDHYPIQCYNFETCEWEKGPVIPPSVTFKKAVCLGSTLYAVTDQCCLYKLTHTGFEKKSSPPFITKGSSCIAVNDWLFAVGGSNSRKCGRNKYISYYSPTMNAWSDSIPLSSSLPLGSRSVHFNNKIVFSTVTKMYRSYCEGPPLITVEQLTFWSAFSNTNPDYKQKIWINRQNEPWLCVLKIQQSLLGTLEEFDILTKPRLEPSTTTLSRSEKGEWGV